MNTILRGALLCAALAAGLTAFAQPASAPMAGASAPHRMGPGGVGPGRMGPRYGSGVTPGWPMMSPEERNAHREAMAAAKTQAECAAVRDRHHAEMLARAKERGVAMPGEPRRDVCAGLPKP